MNRPLDWGRQPDGTPTRPRLWQEEALPVVMRDLRDPELRQLVVACTGAGKSVFQRQLCALVVAAPKDGVVVLDVPRTKLVRQMHTTMLLHPAFSRLNCTVWYGNRKRLPTRGMVIVCRDSLQTLADELEVRAIPVRLYMADEAHLAPEGQRAFVERIQPARIMGVTATPYRSDTDDGLDLWTHVSYRYTMQRALREGVLVPARPITWSGDEVVEVDDAIGEMIRKHKDAGPVLCTALNVADATAFALRLRGEFDTVAEVIHGGMSGADRDLLIARLVDPADPLECLVHVDTLTEGVDVPQIAVIALRRENIVCKGRPERGGSRVRLVQQVGRGLRASPGKTECIVLDPLGVMQAMGLDHPEALALAADGEEDEEVADKPADDRSKAQRNRDERESVMVYPVSQLEDWVRSCVFMAQQVGLVPADKWEATREDPATAKQVEHLSMYVKGTDKGGKRTRPIRVPAPHNRLLRHAAERVVSGGCTRGLASDLLSICYSAARRYGEFKDKQGRYPRGAEHWPCRFPPPPGDFDLADEGEDHG